VWQIVNGQQTKVTTFVAKPNDPSTHQQTFALANFSAGSSAGSRTFNFEGAATDPGTDTLTFVWAFGGGGTGTGTHVTHTFAAPGTYNVSLTVSDGEGGATNEQITVTVP
jgi:PKD repeat protein